MCYIVIIEGLSRYSSMLSVTTSCVCLEVVDCYKCVYIGTDTPWLDSNMVGSQYDTGASVVLQMS